MWPKKKKRERESRWEKGCLYCSLVGLEQGGHGWEREQGRMLEMGNPDCIFLDKGGRESHPGF